MNGAGEARSLRVRIDELRLEGFNPRDRYRIIAALERELSRLLAERAAGTGGLEASRTTTRADGGSFTFRADDSPAKIGAAIARATFRGMTAVPRARPGSEGGG